MEDVQVSTDTAEKSQERKGRESRELGEAWMLAHGITRAELESLTHSQLNELEFFIAGVKNRFKTAWEDAEQAKQHAANECWKARRSLEKLEEKAAQAKARLLEAMESPDKPNHLEKVIERYEAAIIAAQAARAALARVEEAKAAAEERAYTTFLAYNDYTHPSRSRLAVRSSMAEGKEDQNAMEEAGV